MTDKPAPKRRPSSVSRDVTLGGQTLKLIYDFKAVARLEDAYDLPLAKLGERFSKVEDIRVRDLMRLLWAGLATHHEAISQDQVLTMLDAEVAAGTPVEQILGDAFAAWDASAGGEEAAPPSDPPTAA